MQKKQLKISDTSIRASEVLQLEWDEIVIGNPGCYHKFMQQDDIEYWVEYTITNNIKLVMEIPVVFQKHAEELLEKISGFINQHNITSFIINDFGTLFEMKRLDDSNLLDIRIGQLLNFSHHNSPWSEKSLDHELDNIKLISKEGSLESDYMIDLLTSFNVKEVEINPITLAEKTKEIYQSKGLSLSGVVNAQLLAISRSCHALRLFGEEVGNCQALCNKPLDLDALYKWERYDDQLKRISLETRDSLSSLKLLGNSVWLGKNAINSGENVNLLNTVSMDIRVQEYHRLVEDYHVIFSKKVLT
ncbi:hypothetical protein RYX56_06500 [Alkalihalophilus lindianensis]|uniref:Uncharacterized protein n=1 Tax=Alkalihalophilus lindianensis TaxID=1630542 RepID=A0ABU3X803_9BACI|nr:hypothetical protein [Alkalihalophilus lindianensis]MDV2684021.1 hypothetical protein [Alkalihalophilus lindianensis]